MVTRLLPRADGPSYLDHRSDFFRQWISARSYSAGGSIYPELSAAVEQHHVAPYAGIISRNTNPPACCLLVLPFAESDFRRSFLWWNLCSLAGLGICVWLILRDPVLAYSPWIFLPVVTLLLLSRPLAEQTHMGQLSLVLLLLVTIAWAGERRGQSVVSGAAIGLATAVKLFPGLLLVHFVARRNWTAVGAFSAAFGLVYLLCGLMFGWDSLRTYVVDVLPGMSQYFDGWLNASLRGFCAKLFDPQGGHVHPLWNRPLLGWSLYAGGSLLIVALLAHRSWRVSPDQDPLHLSLCAYVVAMLLVSPITWDHYFLLLVLPLGVLWAATSTRRWTRYYLLANILVLGMLKPAWIWGRTIPGHGEFAFGASQQRSIADPFHTLTVISYPFYLLVLLFAFAWWAAGRYIKSSTA